MIRILHVTKELGSGGIESMIMNIYRNIDRQKVQFDFAIHTEIKGFYEEEAMKLGARIYRFKNLRKVNLMVYNHTWDLFWSEHLDEYSAVHAHYMSHEAFILGSAKKNGVVTIAHSHNTFSKTAKGFLKTILMYPVRFSADYLFACSYEAGEYMFGGAFDKRGTVINNAIDSGKYCFNETVANVLRENNDLCDKFVVGHVGNYTRAKNHLFLVDIFSEIVKIKPKTKLILIGSGTDEIDNEMWKKINDLNLSDKVMALGRNNQVHDWLQVMDAFVFPSLHEGLPVAVIEAQAAGVRCVISDSISNEVIVSNEIIQKSINDSAKEWAQEVIGFCRNYTKKNTINEIKEHGYDIKIECKKLQQFYLELSKQ